MTGGVGQSHPTPHPSSETRENGKGERGLKVGGRLSKGEGAAGGRRLKPNPRSLGTLEL